MTPAVTVILPVRNGAAFVADAVRSVFTQTCRDWELVVIDDGSTDDSRAVALDLRREDPIRVSVWCAGSQGLAAVLNFGVRQARAPLIARLDADDWMLPTRLERQVDLLGRVPELGLVGSAVVERGAQGESVRLYPGRDEDIRRALPLANPFAHSSVCFRREVFERAGGYDPSFPVAQDYDLWARMLPLTRAFNFATPLTVRRLHPGQVSVQRAKMRRIMEARVRLRLLRRGEVRAAWPCLRACLGAAVG